MNPVILALEYLVVGILLLTRNAQLLAPAVEALGSPCLAGAITEYSWANGIALMTVFTMFLIELIASRFDIFGEADQDLECCDPALAMIRSHERDGSELDAIPHTFPRDSTPRQPSASVAVQHHADRTPARPDQEKADNRPDQHTRNLTSSTISEASVKEPPTQKHTQAHIHTHTHNHAHTPEPTPRVPVLSNDLSYPPGGEDHLGHAREHSCDGDSTHFAAQMTALFILEFGVIFHSIFIGLTLAVTDSNFVVLYIVLTFHQTFEGLGLGSRLATAQWPKSKRWLPWVLGGAYGITTPIAIAVGLGVRASFKPGSRAGLLVNGVFDSISAGILIYTGLVELMAHEFMFNQEMRRARAGMVALAFGCMCAGAGIMALLGKWA